MDKKNNKKEKENPKDEREFDCFTFNSEIKFKMPRTKRPIHFTPILYQLWKWGFKEILEATCLIHLVFYLLDLPNWFFILNFLFWRLAYDLGIGYLLYKQSTQFKFVEFFKNHFNFDKNNNPKMYNTMNSLLKNDIEDQNYEMGNFPPEFNAWLMFRFVATLVLSHDLFSYIFFALKYLEFPQEFTLYEVLSYTFGVILILISLWAKKDAYNVVKDFAWYWGDFFFLYDSGSLTFDRVFNIIPHPMYTAGYLFYYGASFITKSYTVLYVGLVAHAFQFVFLYLVEDPHINKIYNKIEIAQKENDNRSYFKKYLIAFNNFSILKATDVFFVIILLSNISQVFFDLPANFFIFQVITWRSFHVFLSYILYRQSKDKLFSYYFNTENGSEEAFQNWKAIFNLSLTMQWVSFSVAAVKLFTTDVWTIYGFEKYFLKQVIGILLIILNAYSSFSSYEVVGDYGFFYGDFFLENKSITLSYKGIYRYLNNPDTITGYAGFYGIAFLSESISLFVLAAISQATNYLFVQLVEKPHMKKLYGESMREKSGLASAIEQIIDEQKKDLKESSIKLLEKIKSSTNILNSEPKEKPVSPSTKKKK